MPGWTRCGSAFYGMGADTYNAVMRGLEYHKTVKGLLKFLTNRDRLTKVQISLFGVTGKRERYRSFQRLLGAFSGLR